MLASSPAHGSSVVRPLSLVPYWACDLHFGASPLSGSSLHRTMACSWLFQRDSSQSPAYHRPHVSISAGFPSGIGFLGNPTTVPHLVDTYSWLRTTQGYSVPHRRLPRCEGPHSSPGFLGVSLGRLANRPALIHAILAQANNPRRLVQPNDDSHVDSSAYPYTALLDGIPSRTLSDRLLSPLLGLMVSRYPRGYAFTSPPEGQELHLHGDEVIKDPMIMTLYPLSSCGKVVSEKRIAPARRC